MSTVSTEFVAALRNTFWLPELPEADAFDTLDRLRELEASLVHDSVAPYQDEPILKDDYIEGTARFDDDLLIKNQAAHKVLVSAEHSVDPIRKDATGKDDERADHGTGGLALLLAERNDATAIIPRGRLTKLSNENHPVKQAISLLLPRRLGFASMHGMKAGKVTSLTDVHEIHAIIGLGNTPNEQSRLAAEQLVAAGEDLGLRVIIGNYVSHNQYDPDTFGLLHDKDGKVVEKKLAALAVGTTTNYAYRLMERRNFAVPAFQLEMTRLLRLLPEDFFGGWHASEKARAIGVHTGYLLARKMIELVGEPTK